MTLAKEAKKLGISRQAVWFKTEKGRKYRKEYQKSDKSKEYQKKYKKSDKYKEYRKKYYLNVTKPKRLLLKNKI